jgi:hypothetical protein
MSYTFEVPDVLIAGVVTLLVLALIFSALWLILKPRLQTSNEEWSHDLARRVAAQTATGDCSSEEEETEADEDDEEYEDPEVEEIRQVLAKYGIHLNPDNNDEIFFDDDEDEWVLWLDCDGPYGLAFLMIFKEEWKAYVDYSSDMVSVPFNEVRRLRDETRAQTERLRLHLQRLAGSE